jgi:hypothetical protein
MKLSQMGHYLRRNSSETGRVPVDYHVKQQKLGESAHYFDHRGNYITSTGHIVDDYAHTKAIESQLSHKIRNKFVGSRNIPMKKISKT